ncbi:hypothetical protein H9L12_04200 [Sphingomonas rhizophila]|uniref:DUF2029 domain-containing protein n=1 Tax=Sphingomonas rhizophila TaxID=2071607 RepID=A0A7G9SD39_9SPHN|nr:hypothetical protein [Sphingomonas rhizophila]QNN65764.1 hypothetical protein H9L12_04200 [Sphingomonas rhizophila]
MDDLELAELSAVESRHAVLGSPVRGGPLGRLRNASPVASAAGAGGTPDHLLILFAYAGLSSVASTSMMWGNVALLMTAASCLLALGLVTNHRLTLGAALVLLALKPNIGVPIYCAIALLRPHFVTAVVSGLISGVLALPALLTTSPMGILRGLSETASLYESYAVNSPPSQTGVAHLAYLFGGVTIPGSFLIVAAAITSAVLVLIARWKRPAPDDLHLSIATLFASLATTTLFVRLHAYDLGILLPLVALAAFGGRIPTVLVTIGAFLLFRPENLATILQKLGLPSLLPGTLPTVACLCFFVAAMIIVSRRARDTEDKTIAEVRAVPA